MTQPSARGLFDRVLGAVSPSADRDFAPPPRTAARDLFVLDRRLRLPGGVLLPTRATLIRLANGALFVHSPVRLDPATREAAAALGPVRFVVAPNSFHYLFAAEWLGAFPGAAFHLAPGLATRRPGLPEGHTLTEEPPAGWRDEIDQAVFGPSRGVAEVAFLHRSSRTLLLTDLAFHIRSARHPLTRLFFRLNDCYGRFGPSRTARIGLLARDPTLVRVFVSRLLAWDFDRVIVAHGDVLETGGPAALRAAFAAWLGSGRA